MSLDSNAPSISFKVYPGMEFAIPASMQEALARAYVRWKNVEGPALLEATAHRDGSPYPRLIFKLGKRTESEPERFNREARSALPDYSAEMKESGRPIARRRVATATL